MSSTTSTGIAQVQAYFDALTASDLDAAVATMSEDATLTFPVASVTGREAIRGLLATFDVGFPDATFELTTHVEGGGTVATEGVYHGTHTGTMPTPNGPVEATGKRVSIPFANVAVLDEDGLVASHRAYWDQLDFLAQLGLLPGS